MVSTVNAYAVMTEMNSGRSALKSRVSSRTKITDVKGTRIVPPSTAPMLMSGQNPTPSKGKNIDSTPPSAPPIINNGASTPPDVPDPSANAQMADFTQRTPMMM